jgi:hypothetical protein
MQLRKQVVENSMWVIGWVKRCGETEKDKVYLFFFDEHKASSLAAYWASA